MKQPRFYEQWRKKAVAGWLLIAFGPVLLVAAIRAADETVRVVFKLLGPIIPYVVVVLVLAGIYRLVFGRRQQQ